MTKWVPSLKFTCGQFQEMVLSIKKMESMVVERCNTETVEALKTSLRESTLDESKNKQSPASAQSKEAQDPGLVSKALYAKLELEPL